MTSKPSRNEDAIQNTTALMTNRKSPILKRVTGSVRINKTGLTTKLRRPITKDAHKAELNPFTIMPWSNRERASKAAALRNHFAKILIMCRY